VKRTIIGTIYLTVMTENAVFHGNADSFYTKWASPDTIISDGAYGVSGFKGDPRTHEKLAEWYKPHIKAWTEHATTQTSLWFWNTEVGWATVHPVLIAYGWEYVQLITWNKGISHIAGNVNSNTIRRFPVSTEVSGLYIRPVEYTTPSSHMSLQEWLRSEWQRAGLTFNEANTACGVANAASRK
jgi:hypothetical protein